jgi:hypothetical protein
VTAVAGPYGLGADRIGIDGMQFRISVRKSLERPDEMVNATQKEISKNENMRDAAKEFSALPILVLGCRRGFQAVTN